MNRFWCTQQFVYICAAAHTENCFHFVGSWICVQQQPKTCSKRLTIKMNKNRMLSAGKVNQRTKAEKTKWNIFFLCRIMLVCACVWVSLRQRDSSKRTFTHSFSGQCSIYMGRNTEVNKSSRHSVDTVLKWDGGWRECLFSNLIEFDAFELMRRTHSHPYTWLWLCECAEHISRPTLGTLAFLFVCMHCTRAAQRCESNMNT